jgi:calcium-dependent protein kinase
MPQNDIWSIGVIIYFLLTGIMPFDGPDKQRVKLNILKGMPSFTGSEWDDVTPDGKDLVKKMLSFKPGISYATRLE